MEELKNNPQIEPYLSDNFFFQIARFLFGYGCRLLFTFYTPLQIIGKENLPKDTSFLICANHNSHMDTAILGLITCNNLNQLGALAAKDYWFDRGFFHLIANSIFNIIPIQRSKTQSPLLSIGDTIYLCAYFLKNQQHKMVIYPEGTRSANGKMQVFRNGISYFAIELNKPVVPIYLDGTFRAWGRNKIFIRPIPIRAIIGKPIDHSLISLKNKKAKIKKMTRILYREMERLQKQL